MIAVDTNVLARLLLRDDEAQYRKVVKLFGDGRDYTAPVTVMLELVWVLESYERTRAEIVMALTALLGLPNFKPKQKAALLTALSGYGAGLDFGDAFHLALSSADEAFATFDKSLNKLSRRVGLKTTPVELL
jgi:predicted nucleic-acid-binding protein